MKKTQKTKTIKIARGNGGDFRFAEKTKGEIVSIWGLKGLEFVIHKTVVYSGYTLTEVSTGHACGNGHTKEQAIKNFKFRLKEYGRKKFPKLIKKRISENKKNGLEI